MIWVSSKSNIHFSQICLGIDLDEKSQKSKFNNEFLPEAVSNLFLITRRIQARHSYIPDRPVCMNSKGVRFWYYWWFCLILSLDLHVFIYNIISNFLHVLIRIHLSFHLKYFGNSQSLQKDRQRLMMCYKGVLESVAQITYGYPELASTGCST